MKRTVITVDGNGMLSIPSNLQDLWMSEGELVDMLHVTAMKLHAVIRSIYKDGLLTVSEVQQKQETSNGIWQTLYGFPILTSSLKKHAFYNLLINNILYLCVT